MEIKVQYLSEKGLESARDFLDVKKNWETSAFSQLSGSSQQKY